MTLARRLATVYAWMSAACLALVAWLGYHEFIEEPAEFAAMGLPDIHKNTQAELSTVCFLACLPVLLGLGWWWMRRVLAPLATLTAALDEINPHDLPQPLPRSMSGDEADKLAAAFNSMTVRLDESFRRIHEFTLHASHELKTPLTIMRVQLETRMQDEKSLSPEDLEWLECELGEVLRLSNIVDSLTLLTKGEAGQVKLERKPVRLDELVRESFDDAQVLAEAQGVKVALGECAAVEFSGDRHRLRQLLLNLADNAVKYNHPGGSVAMALRRRNGTAEIEITNTGEGIPTELQPRVFERFVRGDEARSRAIEGCGLGLSICRWIVQSHGGTIQLSSDAMKRTTALVRLPLA